MMPLTGEMSNPNDEWFDSKPDPGLYLKWNRRHVALAHESEHHRQWFGTYVESQKSAPFSDSCPQYVTVAGPSAAPVQDARILDILRQSKGLATEFEALSKRWLRDTRHVSLISEKITHPEYLRIIGMGDAAIPLLLTALREKPAHWFAALRAISNTDPAAINDSPAMAREAWIQWGLREGYID